MSFEREIMGWLCLSIVWLNTGLVCLQALSELRERLGLLRRFRSRAPGERLLRGKLSRRRTDAPTEGHTFGPRLWLLQTARGRGDGRIYLHDRPSESTATPFSIELNPGSTLGASALGGSEPSLGEGPEQSRPSATTVDVDPAGGRVWVWPSARRIAQALPCSSVEEFDAFAPMALHARGAPRRLEFGFAEGQSLFVYGRPSADGRSLGPGSLGPFRMRDSSEPIEGEVLLVSEEDPRRILRRQVMMIGATLLGVISLLVALTALTLSAPVFGTVSKVGAFGLLVFLLLVQPLGVWLSEQVLPPHRFHHGGVWDRARLASVGRTAGVITLDDSGNEAAPV